MPSRQETSCWWVVFLCLMLIDTNCWSICDYSTCRWLSVPPHWSLSILYRCVCPVPWADFAGLGDWLVKIRVTVLLSQEVKWRSLIGSWMFWCPDVAGLVVGWSAECLFVVLLCEWKQVCALSSLMRNIFCWFLFTSGCNASPSALVLQTYVSRTFSPLSCGIKSYLLQISG